MKYVHVKLPSTPTRHTSCATHATIFNVHTFSFFFPVSPFAFTSAFTFHHGTALIASLDGLDGTFSFSLSLAFSHRNHSTEKLCFSHLFVYLLICSNNYDQFVLSLSLFICKHHIRHLSMMEYISGGIFGV